MPALMDDKNEKITATDIFETKIGKLKSTANKIMKKLEKFNIITLSKPSQQNPLLKQKETTKTNKKIK